MLGSQFYFQTRHFEFKSQYSILKVKLKVCIFHISNCMINKGGQFKLSSSKVIYVVHTNYSFQYLQKLKIT